MWYLCILWDFLKCKTWVTELFEKLKFLFTLQFLQQSRWSVKMQPPAIFIQFSSKWQCQNPVKIFIEVLFCKLLLPGSERWWILIFFSKFKIHDLENFKKILEIITLILFNKLTKFIDAAYFWCKDEDLLSFRTVGDVISLIVSHQVYWE